MAGTLRRAEKGLREKSFKKQVGEGQEDGEGRAGAVGGEAGKEGDRRPLRRRVTTGA